jgi:hypothetical protein
VNGVGGVDPSSGSGDIDAHRRDDDDLERLRQREATLSDAYKRNPGDTATMGALVRVQQALREATEHASWLAQGGTQSSHDQLASLGVNLPVDVAQLPPAKVDVPADVLAAAAATPTRIAPATAPPPVLGHPVAPDAWHGVGLYWVVAPELPPTSASAGGALAVGPYRLHLATSQGAGVYFVAYNTETKRSEYAVGARDEDVESFRGLQSSRSGFPNAAEIAALSAPHHDYEILSQRALNALLEGRPSAAMNLLVDANLSAFETPEWWIRNVATLGTANVAPELPTELPPPPAVVATPRVAPQLYLAVDNAATELRPLAATFDGNAAVSLAPQAARPALTLVPPPAAAEMSTATMTWGDASLHAMPWLAPGLLLSASVLPSTSGLTLGGTKLTTALQRAEGSDELANGCVGRPLGFHLGGDDVHNACADSIGNDYPGSDYVVVTPEGQMRAFDLARLPEVGEVKTGKLRYYSEPLANRTIEDYSAQAIADKRLAEGCGLTYTLYIADPAAADFFARELPTVNVELADDATCKRP